jgi:hypothetical protein
MKRLGTQLLKEVHYRIVPYALTLKFLEYFYSLVFFALEEPAIRKLNVKAVVLGVLLNKPL